MKKANLSQGFTDKVLNAIEAKTATDNLFLDKGYDSVSEDLDLFVGRGLEIGKTYKVVSFTNSDFQVSNGNCTRINWANVEGGRRFSIGGLLKSPVDALDAVDDKVSKLASGAATYLKSHKVRMYDRTKYTSDYQFVLALYSHPENFTFTYLGYKWTSYELNDKKIVQKVHLYKIEG